MAVQITAVRSRDVRFDLPEGAGADAVHTDPQYGYAVAELETDGAERGVGLAFTLGTGTDLVCGAIDLLGERLEGREVGPLMAEFGDVWRSMADHHRLRWLGPHKGVVHLALAALSNACFDLWAKVEDRPLWHLLLDRSPEELIALVDWTYVEDLLSRKEALSLLRREADRRSDRRGVLEEGYPAYDTSVGWSAYSADRLVENARRSVENGFAGVKIKVGAGSIERDAARVNRVREAIGPEADLMVDANQQWSVEEAIEAGMALAPYDPAWIEEPTHPDDLVGHQTVARALAPTPVALGEHVPNRIVFKNYLQERAASILQCDATRLGGVGEFLGVSLLARRCGVPVVPHAGDVGQIHQHLVLVNHVALGHPARYLEYIPHLQSYFERPVQVENGRYRPPTAPGASTDLALD